MDNYLELYKNMLPNSIKLSYKGVVTFELVDSMLQIISVRLDAIEENVNVRRKVYCVFMECLQNLCNYIEDQMKVSAPYDSSCAFLSIENESGTYIITTGNFIQNEKIPKLKDWLDKINNASADELKKLYNQILTNAIYNTKGGGGLGFLDIARKTNGDLRYNFQPIDDRYSFFNLQASIKR